MATTHDSTYLPLNGAVITATVYDSQAEYRRYFKTTTRQTRGFQRIRCSKHHVWRERFISCDDPLNGCWWARSDSERILHHQGVLKVLDSQSIPQLPA